MRGRVVLVAALWPTIASASTTPEQFGARVDDGVSDRAGLQAAVDLACGTTGVVELAEGTYDLDADPTPGSRYLADLRLECPSGIVLRGRGARATQLRMVGSCVRPGQAAPGDRYLVGVQWGARDVLVEGLTLDGSERVDCGEQTHLLQVRSTLHAQGRPLGDAVQRVVVRDVTLRIPRLEGPQGSLPCDAAGSGEGAYCDSDGEVVGWFGGGDCVRVVGDGPGREVVGVALEGVTGESCARSWLAVQRGVRGVDVVGGGSRVVGDASIDVEVSGGFGVSGLVVRGARLGRGSAAEGAYAVQVSVQAAGGELVRGLEVVDSLLDGGVLLQDVEGARLRGLRVEGRPAPDPVLYASRTVRDLRVSDSTIVRPPGGMPGPVVGVYRHGSGYPRDVTISASTLLQGSSAAAIVADPCEEVTLLGSRVELDPAAPAQTAVLSRTNGGPSRRVEVQATVISGPWRYAVVASSVGGGAAPSVTVVGGASTASRAVVRYAGGAPARAPWLIGHDLGGAAWCEGCPP